MSRATAPWIVAILVVLPPTTAAQLDRLAEARRLYEAAAYEDVLVTLAEFETERQPVAAIRDRHLLGALSLLALDREIEARDAMRLAIAADPTFVLDASAAAPRVRKMFDETRNAALPVLIRARYGEARDALAAKAHARAIDGFTEVCALIDATQMTLPVHEAATLADLRELAAGFLDLSRERLDAEVRRSTVAQAPDPAPAEPERQATVPVPTRAVTPTVEIDKPTVADVEPPVPVSQAMPAPTRMLGLVSGQPYRGAIEIDIDATGAVTAARLVQSISPAYDARVLAAALRWEYRPARRNGVAMPYTRRVDIMVEGRE